MAGVGFGAPPEVVFDYLVDPANRPQWQSSLRRVTDVDGDVRVGQTWVDVTTVGVRPRMETTALERPGLWREVGTWGLFSAEVTLTIRPDGAGSVVDVAHRVAARGPLAPVGWLLDRVAPLAVRADLRRAAAALSRRS
ncbi:SRPBCC family protein [Nocardioides sp. SYSU D00038]|uniref:SRPBCC family protein n=1 Tax=Nocardioides sp. SYSU D00038 TaxID=2812554 RepID=UPI00196780A1|nr:SRPBCC family protein [Nocardioides sp. SYSU D00038]